MRIRDWSSDVCSSDLRLLAVGGMLDEEILALEMEGQQFGERGVVLDQQHSGGGHASVSFYSVTAGLPPRSPSAMRSPEIGRASLRERVCLSVYLLVGAVPLKTQQQKANQHNKS